MSPRFPFATLGVCELSLRPTACKGRSLECVVFVDG